MKNHSSTFKKVSQSQLLYRNNKFSSVKIRRKHSQTNRVKLLQTSSKRALIKLFNDLLLVLQTFTQRNRPFSSQTLTEPLFIFFFFAEIPSCSNIFKTAFPTTTTTTTTTLSVIKLMESQLPLLYELRLMYKKYIHAGGDENEQTSGRNPLKFVARLAGQLKAAKLLPPTGSS